MGNAFFDKEAGFSTYKVILQENEHLLRMRRLGQAEEALQRMEQDINVRKEELNKVYTFVENKQANYEQLAKQYEMAPSKALAKQMTELKQILEMVYEKLRQTQPEKVIADLSSKYEEFKTELAQKKALINTQENLDIPTHPKNGMP
ncbi:hypothetical protein [Legionella jamestowniensis]|uniref:Uncharacterized protein n=1 Tax=Legionella jamestowniensis TaxID=455 RepID=A0A0W0UNN1_9GAMM|nr:hypothetical protein [Legionella jamestowniensis]KTD09490.1 hypothetical protein Ljam_0840 [Legionella jamestowniensis]OCH98666.1 hypothetical protein A8135_10190 [Legionella jamestowniensis]SFL90202.1 hypothetical protein SAMN02746073_2511 [Legionella jamestowniensis DSM 19215]